MLDNLFPYKSLNGLILKTLQSFNVEKGFGFIVERKVAMSTSSENCTTNEETLTIAEKGCDSLRKPSAT